MIRFQNNLASVPDANDNWAGRTVGDVIEDVTLAELLGLNGGESAEVSRGTGGFAAVNNNFVLSAGDVVRFTIRAGNKG